MTVNPFDRFKLKKIIVSHLLNNESEKQTTEFACVHELNAENIDHIDHIDCFQLIRFNNERSKRVNERSKRVNETIKKTFESFSSLK